MPANRPEHAVVSRKYTQESVVERLEVFFLDNLGKIATRKQLIEVAKDPKTGKMPENWHQRVSELRTDHGYTIFSQKDLVFLKTSEYMMPNAVKRPGTGRRVKPSANTWRSVLEKYKHTCAWDKGGEKCGLQKDDIDPVGGGRVRLTPDHKKPHSLDPAADANDPSAWQPLCGRHQVMKKNFWDDKTGKLNVLGIIQAASRKEKKEAYELLKEFFGEGSGT